VSLLSDILQNTDIDTCSTFGQPQGALSRVSSRRARLMQKR